MESEPTPPPDTYSVDRPDLDILDTEEPQIVASQPGNVPGMVEIDPQIPDRVAWLEKTRDWAKEHHRYIIPVTTFSLGFIAASTLYATLHFTKKKYIVIDEDHLSRDIIDEINESTSS